jgi:hypothetical protein
LRALSCSRHFAFRVKSKPLARKRGMSLRIAGFLCAFRVWKPSRTRERFHAAMRINRQRGHQA